jgi:NitT/TauT family transport system substrate-binding protein
LCLGFFLLACRRSPPPPISIGVVPWIGYEYLHLAARQEFFAAEDVEVRLVEFGSINDAMRAFQRAQLDGFACTPVELLRTLDAEGRPFKVFQVLDFSDGADVVLTRKSITDVAGLRGMRVAIEPGGTVTTFLLFRALESAGMTLDDVTLVPTELLQMLDAFMAGRVDAVVTFPPVSSTLLATGQVNTIFTSERVPGEIFDVIVMDAALLQVRPDAAAAILRAHDRAIDFVETNPSEAYAFVAARLNLKVEEVATLMEKDIHVTPLAEQAVLLAPGGPILSSLRANAEIQRRTGALSRALDFDGLIAYEPLRRALGANGATTRVPLSER